MLKRRSRSIFVLLAALFSIATLSAEAPAFRWAKRFGGEDFENGSSIVVDKLGYSYVTGYFQGEAYFGEHTLQGKGEADIFIAKVDRVGGVVWVRQIGGAADDYARSVALDGENNVYITGSFQSQKIDFGDGKIIERSSDSEIFVAKFNPENKLVWVRTAGSGPGGSGNDLALDLEGNVYVAGYFQGMGVFGDLTLENNGYVDIFVARYDYAGNLVWVRQMGGPSDDIASSIAVDEQGSIFVAGAFSETMQLSAKVKLSSEGLFDAFLIKLDSEGRTAWAVSEGGYMNDVAYDLALDPAGNIIVTGGYAGSESFGSEFRMHAAYRNPRRRYTRAYFGGKRLTSQGGSDVFIGKYNPAGKLVWVQSIGGNKAGAPEAGFGVAVDARGHAHVTGSFAGRVMFGNNTLISRGIGDVFVTELDREGRVLWARQAGAQYGKPNVGYGIAVDRGGNCYVTGFFEGNVAFGDSIAKSYGQGDVFVARLSASFLPPR